MSLCTRVTVRHADFLLSPAKGGHTLPKIFVHPQRLIPPPQSPRPAATWPRRFEARRRFPMPDRLAQLSTRYVRTHEAARLLGISPRTLEKYRCHGNGPTFRKLGGRVVYRVEDLQAWGDAPAQGSASGPGKRIVPPAKRHTPAAPAQTPPPRRSRRPPQPRRDRVRPAREGRRPSRRAGRSRRSSSSRRSGGFPPWRSGAPARERLSGPGPHPAP